MNPTKLPFYLLLIFTALYSAGCSNNSNGESQNNKVINVEVQQVKATDQNQSLSYSGTIEESESIPLSFSTVGSVSRVLVSDGDIVRKGQLLAELNTETFKNAYELSQASLKQAEDAYNRLLPMFKNGNLPEIKLVEVETGLQQAKSATAISKKNLDDCKLYSPVDGVVGKRTIDPGMSAIPNFTSINIVKIEKVFAKVPISESEISSIRQGQQATIKIAALNNTEFTGKVEEIGTLADPIAHTYKIKIGIANKNRSIKPGMICNVLIDKKNETNGLFVPSRSVLVDEKGSSFVYTIKNNTATRKNVKTGKLMQNGVEITEGLDSGEQIVVTGQNKLVDNSLVKIINQ
jgi:RND family efflux transporter MFP subunit